jgi:hypothetical protein
LAHSRITCRSSHNAPPTVLADRVDIPTPLSSWDAVWHDADGLARRHNLRAFALEIYVNATLSEQPGIQALKPRALEVLQAL